MSTTSNALAGTPYDGMPALEKSTLTPGLYYVLHRDWMTETNSLTVAEIYGAYPYLKVRTVDGHYDIDSLTFIVRLPGPQELLALLSLNEDIRMGSTR